MKTKINKTILIRLVGQLTIRESDLKHLLLEYTPQPVVVRPPDNLNSARPDSPVLNDESKIAATIPRYTDKREIAALLKLSVRSVDNLLAAGCPHLKLGKRRVRFDIDEVRSWLSETYRMQRRGRFRG